MTDSPTTSAATPMLRNPDELARQWAAYLDAHPKTRIRDVATALDVSEAELLATRCGDTVTRLTGDWGRLIERLHTLGRVLALTRNAYAVHEKKGVYAPVQLFGKMGQVTGPEIDLRLFLDKWALGFAEVTEGPNGKPRRGLMFFNAEGVAVHKVYLTPESNVEAFDALVAEFRAEGQGREQPVATPAEPAPLTSLFDVDQRAFLDEWAALEDTHDFIHLLRRHDLARIQALEIAEDRFTRQVDARGYRQVFAAAADEGELPVMVFVRSPGLYQIHTGPINKRVTVGEWFNIMDPGFTLHLFEPGVAQVWVVKKPTKHGEVTSVELFDAEGREIAFLFTKRKPEQEESPTWRAIIDALH